MSKYQKFLVSLASELENETIHASDLRRLAAAMDGVGEYYHAALMLAALGAKEEDDAE